MAAQRHHRDQLRRVARQAMLERGLLPDFGHAVFEQLAQIAGPAQARAEVRDLRNLQWCSIDNDDSRDLDQLSVSDALPAGSTRILVAIADVDSLVTKATPIDQHAATNTTSVCTPAQIFPMLPERL